MKVLAIAHTLEPASGWGRYAHSVLDEFRRRGIEYQAAALERGTASDPVTQLAPASFLGFIRNALACREAARGADIVHAFDFWPFAVYGWFAVLGTDKKLFITGVGTYSVAPFDDSFKRFFLARAARRARAIFTIGNYTKRRILEKISLSNIETVFWGTSMIAPLTAEEHERYAAQFSIGDQHPILLTVGEVKHRKGQFDTLRALAKLLPEYPDLLYVMVGNEEREYAEGMRAFAKEHGMERNIRMVGGIRDDRALAFFYSMADLFVMNSNNDGDHFEGFGLVFLEAEQFGLPVVGSRDCGIEEALEDGYNGYLTNQGNAEDIADKISKALENRKALGERSKEFASRFSWEKTVSAYIKAYGS